MLPTIVFFAALVVSVLTVIIMVNNYIRSIAEFNDRIAPAPGKRKGELHDNQDLVLVFMCGALWAWLFYLLH